jgi:hypothetical protein
MTFALMRWQLAMRQAHGEQSTNTNLELIGEAFSYGTENHWRRGFNAYHCGWAADAARSFYLKITSSVDLTNNSHRYACTKYCQQSMDD